MFSTCLFGGFTSAVAGRRLNFLVLTVAAERLELSRMRDVSRIGQTFFVGASLLLLLGSARSELVESWAPLTAAGLLGCAAWLLRCDIARHYPVFRTAPLFRGRNPDRSRLARRCWDIAYHRASQRHCVFLRRLGAYNHSWLRIVHDLRARSD